MSVPDRKTDALGLPSTPTGGVLADILASKRTEIEELRAQSRRPSLHAPLDVAAALRRGGGALRLIAEVKLKSPSAGPLSRVLSPGARAVVYARAGASMVSVLCDRPFFDGSWEDVSSARDHLDASGVSRPVPILAKEFVLDARQVQEARDRGADAVLLIARILGRDKLRQLAAVARAEGVEPLIEVTDEEELDAGLAAEARVIGVNARDLDSLAMDASRTQRVVDAIPREVVAVYLSGLKKSSDVVRVAKGRADAALVGEALMRQDDPRLALEALVDAAATPCA